MANGNDIKIALMEQEISALKKQCEGVASMQTTINAQAKALDKIAAREANQVRLGFRIVAGAGLLASSSVVGLVVWVFNIKTGGP